MTYSRSLVRTLNFGRPEWWQAVIDDDSQTLALRHFRRGEPDKVESFTDDETLRDAMKTIAPMDKWVEGTHDILRRKL